MPQPVSATVDGVTVDSTTGTADALAASLAEPATSTPAPPSAPEKPNENPKEATGATAEPAGEPEGDADGDTASEAGKALSGRKKSLQERLDRATWEKHEERRAREKLEAEVAELRRAQQAPQTQKPADDGRPKLKDFVAKIGTEYESYEDAVDAHTEALADFKLAVRERASLAAQQERGFTDAVHQSNLRGRQSHADFDAKMVAFVQNGKQFTPFMTQTILSDPDKGHDLAYLLATDDAAFQELAQAQTLPQASRILGKLYTRLDDAPPGSSTQAAPVSKAKPPVKPVAGQPHATAGPPGDDASDEEHRLYWNQQEAARRRRA